MKSLYKVAAAAIVLIAFGTTNASAQASATATATATIITPITITKTTDMNFGNVAVQSTTGGTVVMTPAGVRSATAGVTLPATSGTVSAASFTVNGQSGYTYAITLPTSVTLTSASNTMTVPNCVTGKKPQGAGQEIAILIRRTSEHRKELHQIGFRS